MAAHAVIAKSLYAVPSAGVATADAHLAAQLTWYGGDAVHLVVLTLFWLRWSATTLRHTGVARYGTG
ncbi:MAG: putative rane protein [Cryptosporangiaceae bacterium]|nr:putative rane protein [Cryptosporangiaceae bacterium]